MVVFALDLMNESNLIWIDILDRLLVIIWLLTTNYQIPTTN
jgi:hypothetical protein